MAERDIKLADIAQHPKDGGRWIAGKNETGATVTLGLSDKVPHYLIGGWTGSGKTWAMRSALAQLSRDAENRLVLVDAKWGDGLGCLGHLPRLVGPVATDIESARAALSWAVTEMRRRYETGDKRGRLIVAVDEIQELTGKAGDKSELANLLKRLASKARATGVILWLAATHGTADILPRVVSVNLSSRLVFRVQDGNAANVAGCPGAQNIARDNPGRLLARLGGEPIEAQGYFVSDDQLAAIVVRLAGSKNAGPVLTDAERALVAYAVQKLGGAFIIGKLAAAFSEDWTKYKIDQLAKRWERRGWLTRPQHATDSRKVTKELCNLCSEVTG